MTINNEAVETNRDYAAITVDTCIFDQYGLLFDRGLLRQMHQFLESPIDFLMCDIVHSELESHLRKKATDAKSKVSAALKAANPHLSINEESLTKAQALLSSGEEKDISQKRLSEYIALCGARIVKASDHIEVSELTNLYFLGNPPFEDTGNKKNEFPDAIALLTLEAWAKKNQKKVLAISSDLGWKAFSEKSEWVDTSDDLAKSIAAFQPEKIVAELRRNLVRNEKSGFHDETSEAIRNSLDGIFIDVEASASYYYESDDVYATYESHTILNDSSGKPRVNLVAIEEDSIVVNMTCEVICTVNAIFNLQAWDSIDREYLSIGSVHLELLETYETDVLLTLVGELSEGLPSMEIDEIEVTATIGYANFGEIEPDWGEE